MELRDDKQPPLDALFSHPSPESIPGGQRGEQIRLGYEIVVHTQDYAAPYVGNALTCANCHLDGGLDPNSAPFVGLSRVYPEMSRRAGRVLTLADRINECVERGLNGKPIPQDSHKLRAVVAYIDWLSKDVPEGSRMAWRGIPHQVDEAAGCRERGEGLHDPLCVLSRCRWTGHSRRAASVGRPLLQSRSRDGSVVRRRLLHSG